MNTGKALKEIMHRNNISNIEMAEKLNCTASWVSFLRGEKTCSLEMMQKIANIADIKVSDFIKYGESDE